jgi:hypothetical protein
LFYFIVVKIQAQLEAKLDAEVYAQIEVYLNKALGSSCDEDELLKILLCIDAKLAALLKVNLPKIAANIAADVKAAIDVGIKHAKVTIPLLLEVDISLKVDVAVTLQACVKAVISACADISTKVWANAIVNAVV